jgi:uncharacterized protein YjbI with pentapeptide repeats
MFWMSEDLSGVSCESVDLSNCIFSDCSFENSKFRSFVVDVGLLTRCDFSNSEFEYCMFRAITRGENLVYDGVRFGDCDFWESRLERCSFVGAFCSTISFDKCFLYDISFDSLSGESVVFEKCVLSDISKWSFSFVDSVKFEDCVFDGCVFPEDFDWKVCVFERCRFSDCRFVSDCRLNPSVEKGAGGFGFWDCVFSECSVGTGDVDNVSV